VSLPAAAGSLPAAVFQMRAVTVSAASPTVSARTTSRSRVPAESSDERAPGVIRAVSGLLIVGWALRVVPPLVR